MDAYGRFWRQTAPGVHWMVVHKIRELKDRGLRLGLLTNNVKEFGEHWRAMFPLDELFEEVVDSSHVGMRKPDREIYELTCARMAIAADRSGVRRRQRRQRRRRTRVRHGSRALRRGSVGRARRARRDPRPPAAFTTPLTVISLEQAPSCPATAPGRNVRSAPTSAMSSSMRCSVDAIVTSRTGSANVAVAHHQTLRRPPRSRR